MGLRMEGKVGRVMRRTRMMRKDENDESDGTQTAIHHGID